MQEPSIPASPPAHAATLPDAVATVGASVLGLVTRRHAAAAVVWQPGVAVTSASALWRASQVQLVLPGGEAVQGTVRGLDAGTDLAAVTLDGGDVPAVHGALASGVDGVAPADDYAAAAPRVGEFVFAVGREPEGGVHASFGHIGAVGGEWRSWRGGRIERLLRLDGGLYPGLVGAAVARADGRLLGIASPAFSRHHGVVLPAVTVSRVLRSLLAHGRVPRSHLGIAVQPVRASLAGNSVEGLLVSSVDAQGPAAGGGLLVGDVIVSANGRPTSSPSALQASLGDVAPGGDVALEVSRAGQAATLRVAVAERPAARCH
jgi:S1-C subfamily serine protease